MTNQTTSTILDNAIANSQELLKKYALGDETSRDFTTAFGYKYDRYAASDLITQWQTGDFGAFPEIEIRSANEINGANGAYSADTNKIYISEEYLLANASNIKAVSDLVLEEYGHFVDASINTVDSAGDEGAIFSGLVQGESFTEGELQQLQLENDKAIITLDGEEIAIEQREASVTNLAEGFSLKGDETNLHIADFNGDGRDDILRQEKGRNRTQILFADRNGDFFVRNRVTLPEDFRLEGDKTNLHVGDFNGDGRDDFLRQEKGRFDNDNFNTANIFTSNGNGTFSKATLREDFSIKGDETNLYVGDFNGDGRDDILRQEKGRLDDDNSQTAQIIFTNRFGGISVRNRVNLPESFAIKGDLTDLHVGDFNGDGKDDFIRQGKRDSGISDRIFFSNGNGSFNETGLSTGFIGTVNSIAELNTTISDVGDFNGDGLDDILVQGSKTRGFGGARTTTTNVFFSNGNGSFSGAFNFSNLEGFDLSNGLTNLHAADFNGDGFNEILRQEKNSLDDDNIDTAQIFSNIGFHIFGGSGNNDLINGGVKNDTIEGLGGNDSINGGNGNDSLDGGDGNDSLDGGGGNNFLLGGKGDDTLNGGPDGNDTLEGGEGDDLIDGGNRKDIIRGDAGNDTLLGGRNTDILAGGTGADSLNGEEGNDTLRGNSGTDTLNGGEGDDILNGGNQRDNLLGGLGNDILEGGAGDDIIDGGDGDDVAAYQGDIGDFDITINDDGSITVKDTNTEDGDEGTDTLTNISQLVFGGNTRLGADNTRNTVLGVARANDDNVDNISIEGGKAAATNFVIDIEGETGTEFSFDTNKLASFINGITLPDQDIENARLVTNINFELAAGAAGLFSIVPSLGDAVTAGVTTGVGIAQTVANYFLDLEQVNAQREAAIAAVNDPEYDQSAWITAKDKKRDLVVIKDFQIGVDSIFLPSVSNISVDNINSVFYDIGAGTGSGNGVNIEVTVNGDESDLVFIENHYETLTPTEFLDQITNLLVSQPDGGSIVGTFNQTLDRVTPSGAGTIPAHEGTYAGDHIIGGSFRRSKSIKNVPGAFELIGQFGDDFIQGGAESDEIYGGFSSTDGFEITENGKLKDNKFTYEDDGFDVLQGREGDDELFGGSGNDTLDGGGFTYDRNLNVTGVIVGDGTDILTGDSGNDTFVFNTPDTGIDVITDFTVLVDKIQINQDTFGTDISEFSFDSTTGALSFGGEQFATLENNSPNQNLQNFDVEDIELFAPNLLIEGDDSNNTLEGGSGNDTLIGGQGDDLLSGGLGRDSLIGDSGTDTFVFNTLETITDPVTKEKVNIIDVITDFTVSEDIIQINQQGFGASDISEFSFDQTNGALSFGGEQFATLENFANLQNFDVNRDIQLV
ncbi:MAG: FG-GAP-like repeat-containing protein [Cyanobacteria bacterium J06632_19]